MKSSMKFILFVGTISLALTQQANQKQVVETGVFRFDMLAKEMPDNTAVKVDTMSEKIEDIKYDKYMALSDLPEFPSLNPLVVHFTILLLLFAGLLQMLNVFLFKKDIAWIVFLLILGGFAAAVIAGQNFHPRTAGLAENAALIMSIHEKLAEWTLRTALLALILQVVHLFLNRFDRVLMTFAGLKQGFSYKRNRIFMVAIALIMLTSAFCVFRAGNLGAQLVHIEGSGFHGRNTVSD